jgi:putative transcriptional regulator
MVRSRILASVHEAARDLHDAGAMDVTTMRSFDALCVPPVPAMTAKDVRRIRRKLRVSQAVFASMLNVGTATVASWEREQSGKAPSGASLKLLDLVDRKGLDVLT